MNTLIAQFNGEYVNVLSQEDEIIPELNLNNFESIDYSPNYKLDEDQIFRIQEFSEQEFSIHPIRDTFSTAGLTQIANDEYTDISGLIFLGENQVQVQRITKSRFVDRKSWIDFSGQPSINLQRDQVELKSESDAVYLRNSDTLYFKSLPKLKSIFQGIESLHREATQEEVNTFLGSEFIELDDYEPLTVGTLNRKRIADVIQKYVALTNPKKQRLVTYAREKAGLDLNDNRMVVTSENDLKNLLYAMDQRYYYADIYEENRVANSIRVV